MGNIEVFFLSMGFGGLVEVIYSVVHHKIAGKPLKVNHRLSISKRLSMLSLPIWGILGVLIITGSTPHILLFIYSAAIGTILEYALGRFFAEFFGIKVWTYKHGQMGQFTSFYSIPYWGGAGLLFAMVAQIAGL